MGTFVKYEFFAETVTNDEYRDIEDVFLDGDPSRVKHLQHKQGERTPENVETFFEVGVRVDLLDSNDGDLVDRQYAYADKDGNLPEKFNGGRAIPKYIRRKWERV